MNAKKLIQRIESRYAISISLNWVRGHHDYTGNELADALAKEGAAMMVNGPAPFLPIAQAVNIKQIKDFYLNKWEEK